MAKIRHMSCCVCGADAGQWAQHWNRDSGYGICARCVEWVRSRGTSEEEIADLYGKAGVNFGTEIHEPSEQELIAEAKAICGVS